MPSWIPDCSVSLKRESFRGRDDLMPLTHVSMGVVPVSFGTSLDTGVLSVAGILVDEIVFASHAFTQLDMVERDKCDSWLFKLWNELQSQNFYLERLDAHAPTFSDFLQTMITNDTFEELDIARLADHQGGLFSQLANIPAVPDRSTRRKRSSKSSHRWSYSRLKEKYALELATLANVAVAGGPPILALPLFIPGMLSVPSIDPEKAKFMKPETKKYLDVVARWATGRILFITMQERIGLGVAGTEPGDVIVILSYYGDDARTPFAIRAFDQDRYRLVGEAYVHNLKNVPHKWDSWERIDLS